MRRSLTCWCAWIFLKKQPQQLLHWGERTAQAQVAGLNCSFPHYACTGAQRAPGQASSRWGYEDIECDTIEPHTSICKTEDSRSSFHLLIVFAWNCVVFPHFRENFQKILYKTGVVLLTSAKKHRENGNFAIMRSDYRCLSIKTSCYNAFSFSNEKKLYLCKVICVHIWSHINGESIELRVLVFDAANFYILFL